MHGHAVEHLDLHLDDVAEGQFAGAFLEADVGMPWVVADDKNAKRKQINRYVKSYLRQSKKKRVLIVKWKNKTLIYSN